MPEETLQECVCDLLRLAREIGGEGFEDLTKFEIDELVNPKPNKLTAEKIKKIFESSNENQEEVV